MKKHVILGLSLLLGIACFGQNEADALRYSYITHGGSSRYQAMGGALGGLGADFSVAATNPGALGRFSKHKISLSIDNNITTTNTNYNGTDTRANSNKFTLSHAAAIFVKDLANKNNDWQYIQFGVGYNRTTNFHSKINSKGTNNTSIINVFANAGQGIGPADLSALRGLTTNLAWESYAVDFDASTGVYTPRFNDSPMEHDRTVERFGGIGEYTAALSVNYKNKIYAGFSVNAHRINFQEKITHNETIIDTIGGNLLSSQYKFDLKTNGTGINAKFGIVYLPFDWLRIGLSIHTPTRTHLKDKWSADMSTVQKDAEYTVGSDYIPTGEYRYYVISPLRGAISIGAVLGGRWAIGAEVELVNYSWAKLRSTDDTENYEKYDFDVENDEIKNQFTTGANVKLGIEYLLSNNWTARAGYAIYTSPYKREIGNDNTPDMFISGGFGYKYRKLSIDLTYSAMVQKEDYYSFDPSESSNLSQINRVDHRINLGLAFTFK